MVPAPSRPCEGKDGRDLIDVLPALTEDMGPETQRIRFEYWDTAADAFINSYDKQVYEWCEANHLMYIGEKPILRSKELEFVHVPGTDSGHAKVGAKVEPLPGKYRANGKIISSAAHFYNKPAALREAFPQHRLGDDHTGYEVDLRLVGHDGRGLVCTACVLFFYGCPDQA